MDANPPRPLHGARHSRPSKRRTRSAGVLAGFSCNSRAGSPSQRYRVPSGVGGNARSGSSPEMRYQRPCASRANHSGAAGCVATGLTILQRCLRAGDAPKYLLHLDAGTSFIANVGEVPLCRDICADLVGVFATIPGKCSGWTNLQSIGFCFCVDSRADRLDVATRTVTLAQSPSVCGASDLVCRPSARFRRKRRGACMLVGTCQPMIASACPIRIGSR